VVCRRWHSRDRSGSVKNSGWHASPAAIRGCDDQLTSAGVRSGESWLAIWLERSVRVAGGPERQIDDHRDVTGVMLQTRRVDQLTKPSHVETGAVKDFRSWAMFTSHGNTLIKDLCVLSSAADTREATTFCLLPIASYTVIVNCVYPLLVIVGQPDDIDKNVKEKGEQE
jgi:hypothetical protein